jgi:hypothetical protein
MICIRGHKGNSSQSQQYLYQMEAKGLGVGEGAWVASVHRKHMALASYLCISVTSSFRIYTIPPSTKICLTFKIIIFRIKT